MKKKWKQVEPEEKENTVENKKRIYYKDKKHPHGFTHLVAPKWQSVRRKTLQAWTMERQHLELQER